MIGLRDRYRRGHLADERLAELAAGTAATANEADHLDRCGRCRSLRTGFRRADAALSGAWADRAVPGRAGRVAGPSVVRRPVRGGATRSLGSLPLAVVAIVTAVVLVSGLLAWRGQGQPAASPGTSTPSAIAPSASVTAGNRIVARVAGGWFRWSPDGEHLLVGNGEASSVIYDRAGKRVSQATTGVDWLDSGHLIGPEGKVGDVASGDGDGYVPNARAIGSGHGAAAVVVAVPACTGDPMVRWYRDGRLAAATEAVSVFGWSGDGRLGLLGHFNCEGMDAELHGWKGPVQVVEFPSRRVLGTIPAVRGELAFNPSGSRVAAQSDADVTLFDVAMAHLTSVSGARLLGWRDDAHLYVYDPTAAAVVLVGVSAATPAREPVPSAEWQLSSPSGALLVATAEGAVLRVMGPDGTTLVDLASAGLSVGARTTWPERSDTSLQPRWWSPDGRMLALPSADGRTVTLVSIDPAQPRASASGS